MAWFTFWSKTHVSKSGKRTNVLWGMLLVFLIALVLFITAEHYWGPF
jgi:hypothetical protein